MSASLAGLHILITRPAQQAANIRQQLMAAGALVSCLPVLEIAPPQDSDKARNTLQQIDKYDNVIFISRNAVLRAFQLNERLFVPQLSQCRIGAIGNKTALALRDHSVAADDVPTTGFSSEDFLALASMQAERVASHRMLIARGEGGRELLAQVLRQRGATVDYAEVYRRVCPPLTSARALLERQAKQPLDVIALTSGEGLRNLLHLLQSPAWLFATPLLVGSERISQEARALGFKAAIMVAANPGDCAMQEALSNRA